MKRSPRGWCGVAILDRPRRHVHRHRGAPAGRTTADAQAAVGKPRPLPDAAVAGIRALLEVSAEHPGPGRPGRSSADGHHRGDQRAAGTQGRAHALVITRGFGDALRIGYQNRPRIFDRHIVLPETALRETSSRSTSGSRPTGRYCASPNSTQLGVHLRSRTLRRRSRTVAVVCLHSHLYSARTRGDRQVVVQTSTSRRCRVGRGKSADEADPPW